MAILPDVGSSILGPFLFFYNHISHQPYECISFFIISSSFTRILSYWATFHQFCSLWTLCSFHILLIVLSRVSYVRRWTLSSSSFIIPSSDHRTVPQAFYPSACLVSSSVMLATFGGISSLSLCNLPSRHRRFSHSLDRHFLDE